MIKFENVSKSYPLGDGRVHQVFSDLSLTIPAGTHTAVMGGNGSGKSTLLRMIGGIDLPDKGKILREGSISPPLGLKSGVSKQLTGLENAKFCCRLQGDSGAALQERVKRIEEFAELGEFFREPVKTYSSGMRARLAFACSVVFDYDYLLVDELTAVGDRAFKRKAKKVFASMQGNSTLVLVSHAMNQIKQFCDAGIVLLPGGKVTYFDDVKEAIDYYQAHQPRDKRRRRNNKRKNES